MCRVDPKSATGNTAERLPADPAALDVRCSRRPVRQAVDSAAQQRNPGPKPVNGSLQCRSPIPTGPLQQLDDPSTPRHLGEQPFPGSVVEAVLRPAPVEGGRLVEQHDELRDGCGRQPPQDPAGDAAGHEHSEHRSRREQPVIDSTGSGCTDGRPVAHEIDACGNGPEDLTDERRRLHGRILGEAGPAHGCFSIHDRSPGEHDRHRSAATRPAGSALNRNSLWHSTSPPTTSTGGGGDADGAPRVVQSLVDSPRQGGGDE